MFGHEVKFVHEVKLACHATAAVGNLMENEIPHVVSNGLQFVRLAGPPSLVILLITCIGSALIWGLEKRFLATMGYMSLAAGWDRIANALLAFHYGLMSFDAEDAFLPVAISNGGLALAYSAENFQDTPHE